MSDAADLAAQIEAEHLFIGLTRIDPVLPTGIAGECEECGEDMPRLVDGRCGFCRDGVRPPLDWYERLPSLSAESPSDQQRSERR